MEKVRENNEIQALWRGRGVQRKSERERENGGSVILGT